MHLTPGIGRSGGFECPIERTAMIVRFVTIVPGVWQLQETALPPSLPDGAAAADRGGPMDDVMIG